MRQAILHLEKATNQVQVKVFCGNKDCGSYHNNRGRYLGKVNKDSDIEIRCPTCKTVNFVKIKF